MPLRDRQEYPNLSNPSGACTGKSLSEALTFAEQGGEHVYINCSECQNQFLYTTCSPHILSLEFLRIELVIQ